MGNILMKKMLKFSTLFSKILPSYFWTKVHTNHSSHGIGGWKQSPDTPGWWKQQSKVLNIRIIEYLYN